MSDLFDLNFGSEGVNLGINWGTGGRKLGYSLIFLLGALALTSAFALAILCLKYFSSGDSVTKFTETARKQIFATSWVYFAALMALFLVILFQSRNLMQAVKGAISAGNWGKPAY